MKKKERGENNEIFKLEQNANLWCAVASPLLCLNCVEKVTAP